MTTLLSVFTMTLAMNPHFITGIDWTVDQKVFTYGRNVTLFCNIGNCCFYRAGWNKGSSKELIPIFIDVTNLKDDSNDKYGGKTNKSGFFLTIRDFQEVDLNTEYSCSYEFNVSKWKIMQKNDAFKDLEWIVDQKVSSYGHDLTLFCNVGTCCEYQFRWSKWKSKSQFSPQYINGDKDYKYDEKQNRSGFFLTIRNLREDDLNIEYSCVYNNRPGKRKHLLKSYAFYKESSVTFNPSLEKENENKSSALNLVIPILIGVAVLIFVVFSLIFFLLIRTNFCRQQNVQSSHENNQQQNTTNSMDTEIPLANRNLSTNVPAHETMPFLHSNHIQQDDRSDSLPQFGPLKRLFNLPGFNPGRTYSDQQISPKKKDQKPMPFRQVSSNSVPQGTDSSCCSSGVLNTEDSNFSQFVNNNLSGRTTCLYYAFRV
ncbi:uncharacterized protein [Mytilus edulis]|uniref:uncharacterized protein n=1 Tax=Mytilus edulis TaxID=6550 RepID=UPI0039F125C9